MVVHREREREREGGGSLLPCFSRALGELRFYSRAQLMLPVYQFDVTAGLLVVNVVCSSVPRRLQMTYRDRARC